MDGIGGRLLYIVDVGLAVGFALVAVGLVPYGSRIPELVGRIWYVPISIFFTVLLRWRELLCVEMWGLEISVNKATLSFSSALPSCVWGRLDFFLSPLELLWLEPIPRRGESSGLVNKLEEPSLLGVVAVELQILVSSSDRVVAVAKGDGTWPDFQLHGEFLVVGDDGFHGGDVGDDHGRVSCYYLLSVVLGAGSEDDEVGGLISDGCGCMTLVHLQACCNLSSSLVVQALYLHIQMRMVCSSLCFFTRSELPLLVCACLPNVYGQDMLLEASSPKLLHLQCNCEDVSNLALISCYGGSAIVANEQDHPKSFSCTGCTCLSHSDDCLVEYAVSMLFGLCHRRWTTTPPSLIPRFNSGDPLSLGSVKVIRNLKLNSIPHVHMPDRPLGEPPTGHQLDCTSIEALEDYKCGNFESVLSTDERTPSGSICGFQRLHKFRSSCSAMQLGTYLSCSTLESHVTLYHDL